MGRLRVRDIGENDVFCVLEEVRKHYRSTTTGSNLTGHSMAEAAQRTGADHPDLFAAVAPPRPHQLSMYGYAVKKGTVEARIEGRVVEMQSVRPGDLFGWR